MVLPFNGNLAQLQWWTQSNLPAVYDDSLSFYELLGKVVSQLNTNTDFSNGVKDLLNDTITFINSDKWLDEPRIMDKAVSRRTIQDGAVGYSQLDPSIANQPTTAVGVQAALDDLYKKINEPVHLYVGANQKYKTITAAVNEWKNPLTINKQPTIIFIYKGTYNESIAFYGENPQGLSFVGENKKDVIWKTTQGYYPNHPLTIGGDVFIQGITFIANHDDNPAYTFTPYTSGNTGGAYGLHIDVDGATGKVIVKDCNMISYQNAGLGSGTRTNQEIELINCEISNLTPATWSEPVNNGGWLYHNSVATGATNERLKARFCKFFNANGYSIELQNYNADATFILLEIIGCNCSSGTLANPKDYVHITYKNGATTNKIAPTNNSHGNNVPFLNNQTYFVDVNGNLSTVTDCNLAVMTGEYQIGGNTPNAPTTDAFFLKTLSANSQYKKQIAWKLTDNTVRYERIMSAGVWGAWALR